MFVGKRYLLPVGHVRFDDCARVLRVGLDKEVAARYPAFDRDEFTTLTDDALQGYQGRLLDFFKRRRWGGASGRGVRGRQPGSG